MPSSRRDGSRTGLVGGLLALSLVIALLLAVQTQYAVRSHRRTVEAVLSSCAALAAEELVRRSANEVGYQGYMRILDALPGLIPGPPETSLRPATGADPETVRALALVERVFAVEPGGPRFVGPAPERALVDWLSARISSRAAGNRSLPYGIATTVMDGRPHLFVWSARPGSPRAGFEVSLPALEEVFRRGLARPLLPPALSHGEVANGALSISIRDFAGRERFRSGPAAFPHAARAPFGDAYGGVLQGFVTEVSIDPAVAGSLVPGGLPRSRLPVLLTLLGVSAALAVIAGLQVRRERDLARLREGFVAGVSHELRTPLAQIRLFAETLLLGRARSSQEERRALEIIDREARRLGHLVENVLTFSQTSRASPRLVRTPLDLSALARETVDGFRPLAAVRNVTLTLDAAADVRAPADAGAVSQILVNLLDNAVKHGPAGQEVTVRVRAASGSARVEVEDRGPGVPVRHRSRVFERFTRLTHETGTGVAGAGIGLAVVRELAEAHGGRAFVEDGSQGGALFIVELPLADLA